MQCPQCNRSVHDNAEYCEHCGHKLSSQEPKKEGSRQPSTPEETSEKRKQTASQEEPPRKKEESEPKREERAAHKDQDSRRSDRSENQEKKEEDDKEGEDSKEKDWKDSPPSNGFPWKGILVFLGLVILIILLYFAFSKERRPPPLPEKSFVGAGSEPFFTALREGVHRVGDAKAFYQKAFSYMGPEWSPATLPATTPATLPAQQTNFLKAAENFALALENFNTAYEMMNGIRVKPIEVDQEKCKNDFVQATASFLSASETLNEHAKALYLGDPKRAGRSFITDAKAKYEVADQSLTELLLAGCNGSYFKFLKASPMGEKEQALNSYKTFFGDRFHLHQSAIELLIGYRMTETAPAGPNP